MNERPSQHMPDELARGAWHRLGVSLGQLTSGIQCNLTNSVNSPRGS